MREVRQTDPWSLGVLESFKSWEVSSEPSLSYHSHILLRSEGSVPARLIRNCRVSTGTPFGRNWRAGLRGFRKRT